MPGPRTADDPSAAVQRRRSSPPLIRFRAWLGGSFSPYLYVAPYFVIFFGFFAYPVGYALYLSLHYWAGVGPMRWVGLGNYTFVLEDNFFWGAVQTTGMLWLLIVPIFLALSLLLALVWNRARFSSRSVALTFFLLPCVISFVAVALMFRIIFDQATGPIDMLLSDAHLPTIPWLTSDSWAKISLALVRLWESAGLGSLFFFAALQGIPTDLYDAAAVDGCGPAAQFWRITLPLLTGTVLLLTVVSTLAVLGMFAEPQLITADGGPGTSTLTVGLYLFHLVQGLDFGTASAVSFIMTSMMMIVSVLLFLATRRGTMN